jgi:hypothetical protein
MLNKIQTITLPAPPVVVNDFKELNTAMSAFAGKPICTFIGLSQDHYYVMFTEVLEGDIIAVDKAVGFIAPCPPFCTKGGNEKAELFAWG